MNRTCPKSVESCASRTNFHIWNFPTSLDSCDAEYSGYFSAT